MGGEDMAMGPLRRELYRKTRGGLFFRPAGRGVGRSPSFPVRLPRWLVTLGVALLLSFSIISFLEARLKPIIATAATAQIQNQLTGLIERSVVEDLARRQLGYSDLVTIQREESGVITSLSTDMASMNQLRAQLVNQLLGALEGIDVSTIQIPLGSLFDSELLWAAGPSLHVRAMSVGTVQADFESEFSEAGVNQTRHRIWLHLSIPATVLLAGAAIEVPLDTELCVAETVIVGQVPDTYLSLDGISVH